MSPWTGLCLYAATNWAAEADIALLPTFSDALELQRRLPEVVIRGFTQKALLLPDNLGWLDTEFRMFSEHAWSAQRTAILTSALAQSPAAVVEAALSRLRPARRQSSPGFWMGSGQIHYWYHAFFDHHAGQVVIRYHVWPDRIEKVVNGVIAPISELEIANFRTLVTRYYSAVAEDLYHRPPEEEIY
jgi:hypothetical protein